MKQAKRIRYFTTEDTVTEWNAPVKPANKYFVAILWTNIPCTVYVVVIECYSFLCVIWVFYMGNKFRGAFYSRGSLISRKHEIRNQ